ncbi:fukutin [Caerostris extrusa]|uniref:Fukutin n=1 Tax=Caerostris extrusa TaxID=172846 RepID=A0AAV4UPV7_CAEEX|nr:fukutin [Caerostris extrusa]
MHHTSATGSKHKYFLSSLEYAGHKGTKRKKEVDFAHVFISKVLNLSFKHNVPLFLIDPKKKVLHLATIGPLSTQMQKLAFIEAVEGEKFKLQQFSGSDPVLLQHGLNSPIPLHFIVYDELTTIHISVFYERPAKFWWTGGYFPNDKELHELYELGIRNDDIRLISKPAAFDKVEIHSAAIDKVKIFVPVQQEIFQNYPKNTDFIECNYTQARYFHEKYGRDESDEAEIFRSKAHKLLSKAKTLLDRFFRECGFISHSKDVDIGIWIKDYKPEIISTFSTYDLPLTHSFGKVEDSFELSFIDSDLKLDLCWTEFLELKVRVPCQTEEYIKANYGSKWFEPVKVWDWKNSPPNVLENGQWPLDEWPEVIQLLPLPEQN